MADKLNALFVVMNGSHAMQAKFGLDVYGLAVLIAIANRGDAVTGEMWASVGTLAHDMAMSRKSAVRALPFLLKHDLVQTTGQGRKGVKIRRVNVGLIEQITAQYKAKNAAGSIGDNSSDGSNSLPGGSNSPDGGSDRPTNHPLILSTDPLKEKQVPASVPPANSDHLGGEARGKNVEPTSTTISPKVDQSKQDQSNYKPDQLQPTNRLKPCRDLDPGEAQLAEQLTDLWNEYDPAPMGQKMGRYIDFEIMLAEGMSAATLRLIIDWVFTKSKRKDHPRDWGHPGILQGSAGFRVAFEKIYAQYQRYKRKVPGSVQNKRAFGPYGSPRRHVVVPLNTELCEKCSKKAPWPGSKFCISCAPSTAYMIGAYGDDPQPLAEKEIARLIGAERVA